MTVKRSRRPAWRWAAALLALPLLAACRLPVLAAPSDVPAEARAAYERGIASRDGGDAERALESFRAAIGRAPEFVEAHRAYQNLLLGRHRRGQLINEYQRFLAEAPGSAPRRYLLARLWSDARRQREGFERALQADPGLYFGHVGSGYAALELEDAEGAAGAFRRARALRPERTEAAQGLLRVLLARGAAEDLEEGLEIAHDILARDDQDLLARRVLLAQALAEGQAREACRGALRCALEVPGDEAADLALGMLARAGAPPDFDLARVLLASAPGEHQGAGWLLLCAFVEERAGDPRAALLRVERAPPADACLESVSSLRRRLLLETGRLKAYLEEVFSRRYAAGFRLGDGGAAAAALAAVRAELDSGIPRGARAEEAVRALCRLGLVEAAILLADECLEADPGARGVALLRDEALRHRAFVVLLRDHFTKLYEAGEEPALEEVIGDLRRLARECLGEDIVDPVVVREYFLIGAFLDPDPRSGSGLARYFDRFGTFFVVGKRPWEGPEAFALERIADGREEVAGRDVYRVVGEHLLIPSRTEHAGGEIAGFAFDTFIALNADRARSGAEAARSLWERSAGAGSELLDDPLLAAADRAERLDVREPLSLAARATFRCFDAWLSAGRPAEQYAGLMLDCVEAHEQAHIQDAARFLPLWADLGRKLGLLWGLRFSPARVEAWLEERAQAQALAHASSPLAVLAATAPLLPLSAAAAPHVRGYQDLTRRLVLEVEEHPGAYPEIDLRYAILAQLDRLGDAGLRRLGQSVLAADQRPPTGTSP